MSLSHSTSDRDVFTHSLRIHKNVLTVLKSKTSNTRIWKHTCSSTEGRSHHTIAYYTVRKNYQHCTMIWMASYKKKHEGWLTSTSNILRTLYINSINMKLKIVQTDGWWEKSEYWWGSRGPTYMEGAEHYGNALQLQFDVCSSRQSNKHVKTHWQLSFMHLLTSYIFYTSTKEV